MKMKCNRVLAAAAAVAMALSMAACSGSDSSSGSGESGSTAGTGMNTGRGSAPSLSTAVPSVSSPESTVSPESVSSSGSSSANSSGKYANVRELIKDPLVQKDIEDMHASYEGTGIDIWVDTIGADTFVITYSIDAAAQGASEVTPQVIKTLTDYFNELLHSEDTEKKAMELIADYQPYLEKKLKITYACELTDGTKLASRTFTENGAVDKDAGTSSGSSTAVQKYANVREMMADPDIKKGLDDMCAGYYEKNGIGVRVNASGNDTLVFTYVIDPTVYGKEVTPELIKALSESVDAYLKSADTEAAVKSIFFDNFQPLLDVDLKVTYTYELTDGTKLASRTYSANGATDKDTGTSSSGKKYATAGELLKDPDAKKVLDQLIENSRIPGEYRLEASGTDTVVITYIASREDLGLGSSSEKMDYSTAAVLQILMQTMQETLEAEEGGEAWAKEAINDLQPLVDADLKIILNYQLNDGTELASRTYGAK